MERSSVRFETAAGIGVRFTSKLGVGFSRSVRSGCKMHVPSVVRQPFHTNVQPSLKWPLRAGAVAVADLAAAVAPPI